MKILLGSANVDAEQYTEDFFLSVAGEIKKLTELPDDSEISVLLTCDGTIQELNSNYRSIDKPTDVLSFPMGENNMLGDIVISVETAHRQSQGEHEEEMAFLFIHGVLHLLGYDHEGVSENEAEKMYSLQEKILDAWCNSRRKN